MRAGPLSKTDVIDTLNQHFVPVYLSIEDVVEDGQADEAEKKEWLRVYHEAADKGLSTGTVHAYVLDVEGHPIDSLHVAKAATGEHLLAMLKGTVKKLQVPSGETLVEPKVQSVRPAQADPDGMVVHLTARAEGTGPEDNSWHGFPSENWIVLSSEDKAKLLPPASAGELEVGATWEVDADAAKKVLVYFYPQSENNDPKKNRIEQHRLTATVVSVDGGVVRARLDGSLRMEHWFYHKDDDHYVDATLVGFIDVDPAAGEVREFMLVTDQGTYMNRKFDAGFKVAPAEEVAAAGAAK